MSGCLACMVTDFLLRKNVIRREEREIYQYGYDMLFTGILQSMLLLAVGFILGKTAMTAVFVVVFTTLIYLYNGLEGTQINNKKRFF